MFAVTFPLPIATLALWALPVWPAMRLRPNLVLMVYGLMLAVSLGAAGVCVVAHLQLTINRAFAAGVRAGINIPPDKAPQLRAVE